MVWLLDSRLRGNDGESKVGVIPVKRGIQLISVNLLRSYNFAIDKLAIPPIQKEDALQ